MQGCDYLSSKLRTATACCSSYTEFPEPQAAIRTSAAALTLLAVLPRACPSSGILAGPAEVMANVNALPAQKQHSILSPTTTCAQVDGHTGCSPVSGHADRTVPSLWDNRGTDPKRSMPSMHWESRRSAARAPLRLDVYGNMRAHAWFAPNSKAAAPATSASSGTPSPNRPIRVTCNVDMRHFARSCSLGSRLAFQLVWACLHAAAQSTSCGAENAADPACKDLHWAVYAAL